ncbi:hypothetical protein [Synechococcus sp. 1G10]|nr:hypothetical protein [Synechococcus sp. 1G10]
MALVIGATGGILALLDRADQLLPVFGVPTLLADCAFPSAELLC